jgi:probable HAF family extracellular repeat protein
MRVSGHIVTMFAVAFVAGCGGGGNDVVAQSSYATERSRSLAVGASTATTIPYYSQSTITPGGVGAGASINASGQFIGWHAVTVGDTRVMHAFFFDGTNTIDLGTLGGDNSAADYINSDGLVGGWSEVAPGSSTRHAFVWKPGWSAIRPIHPDNVEGNSVVVGVDDSGRVLVTTGSSPVTTIWTEADGLTTARWPDDFEPQVISRTGDIAGVSVSAGAALLRFDGSVTILSRPDQLGRGETYVSKLNSAGAAAGHLTAAGTALPKAFRWKDGVLDIFGASLDRFSMSRVTAMNESGTVIGNVYARGRFRSFMRTDTALIADIGGARTSGQVVTDTLAKAMNNHGQVVGISGAHSSGRAFAFTQATGVVDLTSRVINLSPGMVIADVNAISDNGTILATNEADELVVLKPVVEPALP